ncbi:hypothetical protein MKQ68_13355 [Chitinophaga horti]|uniref:Uncharacterized protein n=1 Tax=Chitinophaga horti TaxID=2920382 RepID=A0ABY6IUP2_9BACT|nr:hypothetical protein [Chitinophaga horti]UYQ91080.1 hypothetical protein MKQ68_13355 [Chitinophaga horti]
MTANRIINHIFHQPDLQHVDQAELERLVAQYPYFAAARLLLAQKKFAAEHNLADDALKNAQLYSGTPHHLHQFLRENDPATASTAAPRPAAIPVEEPEQVQEEASVVQLARQYYGQEAVTNYMQSTEAPEETPAVEYAAEHIEDERAQYQEAYYGATPSQENNLILTADPEPSPEAITPADDAAENAAAVLGSAEAVEVEAIEQFNTLVEAEENAVAIVEAAEAIEVEAIEQYNTLVEAEENAVAIVEAAEAIEVEAIEQYNTLVEAEENAVAIVEAAEAIEVEANEQYNTLVEAEENALAIVEAAEAIEVEAIEQYNTLVEAEENAVAIVEAAEAIEVEAIEQYNTLVEAEENAVAIVEAAEAIEVEAIEQYNTLVEAAENAVAIVEAAEAIEVEANEQYNALVEAEENAVATVEAAETVEEEVVHQPETEAYHTPAASDFDPSIRNAATEEPSENIGDKESNPSVHNATTGDPGESVGDTDTASSIYNTTIDEPGETIEDTSNTEALMEAAAADQFDTIVAADETGPATIEAPQELPETAIYNTTIDQPGETIEDTSNTEALMEEAAAAQFSTIVAADETTPATAQAPQELPETAIYNTTIDQPGETIEDTSNTEALMEEAAAAQFNTIVAADEPENDDAAPIKIFPLEMPAVEEQVLTFQPLYTDDYFAYKRIKEPEKADIISEKGEAEMKSFTDWLREMKENFSGKSHKDWYHQQMHRLYEDEEPEVSEAVEKMAIESITFNNDIVSETLAEIWVRQHQYAKAILIYQKLSLLNPGKSAYFAQKIKDLQLQTDNNK